MADQKLKVLIVEDEILLSIELEFVLQELGHEVVGVAASSKEALALAEITKPDLALVDIHLNDGPTGIAVANRISEMGPTRCVFMSANVGRIPGDYAGAVGYISKPYTENGFKTAMSYISDGIANPPPTKPRPQSLKLSPDFTDAWAA